MRNTIALPYWVPTLNHALTLKVRYGSGEKFANIADWTPREKLVDNSGFARWVIFHASHGKIRIPDGSANQRAWCVLMDFEPCDYSRAMIDKSGSVFMCFIRPKRGRAGHVWFVRNGVTWESYSGKGIGCLPAKQWYRAFYCDGCFVLT